MILSLSFWNDARCVRTAEKYHINVLENFVLDAPKFDTIAANYLLHCLPASMEQKCRSLKRLSNRLNDGGTLFGSTLVCSGTGVLVSHQAEKRFAEYNEYGFFSNLSDTRDDLELTLLKYFSHVEIKVKGCVVFFAVKNQVL